MPEGGPEGEAVTRETLGISLEEPPEPVGMWLREREGAGRYGDRTWGDMAAALPLARVDRFGPIGFFETFRLGGVGAPAVLVDGIPWPRDGGGLPNGMTLPDAGIGAFEIQTPRILPGLALLAPDGAILLESDPWLGGPPRSFAAAERGPSGWRNYGFGFARDFTRQVAVMLDGTFRQADEFELDSHQAFGAGFRTRVRVRQDLIVRAGHRRHDDDQILIDPALRSGFSHDGSDERRVSYVEVLSPGMIGLVYETRIISAAVAREASFDDVRIADERRGLRVSRRDGIGAARLTTAVRAEARKAEKDGAVREAGLGALAVGITCPVAEDLTARFSVLGEFGEGEEARQSGEGVLVRRGSVPLLLRIGRAWQDRSVGRWVEGGGRPGVVRYGELGFAVSSLPASPGVRYFRREGDSVLRLSSIDAFREDGTVVDERVDGVEVSAGGSRGTFEGEASYLWSRAREKGSAGRPPYHSDHVVRGRVSYALPIPGLPVVPRWDALAEWRSDRAAPERTEPMERWFTLRGRVTLRLRGVDLFAQLEQVLGHRNEYVDGPLPGSDGVLSGSQQIHLGLYWPFVD
ncbi:MAG: hypothetical protein ABIK65_03560 [Candidatus Eisenbacteria bacterium]